MDQCNAMQYAKIKAHASRAKVFLLIIK